MRNTARTFDWTANRDAFNDASVASVTGYPLDMLDDEDEDAYVDRMIALSEG
jgi:hypothetical protein